jgi:small subunit ribosomal protein S9
MSEEREFVNNHPTTPRGPNIKKDRPAVFLKKKRAYLGTGRRKTSVARIFLTDGTGQVTINGRPLDAYFTEAKDRNSVLGPLDVVDVRSRVDVMATVTGGGFTGQAGALCQGIARAVKAMFGLDTIKQPVAEGAPGPDEAIITMAKRLRDSGFLTRDGRMKERKKYGRKGARKSFQFSKR